MPSMLTFCLQDVCSRKSSEAAAAAWRHPAAAAAARGPGGAGEGLLLAVPGAQRPQRLRRGAALRGVRKLLCASHMQLTDAPRPTAVLSLLWQASWTKKTTSLSWRACVWRCVTGSWSAASRARLLTSAYVHQDGTLFGLPVVLDTQSDEIQPGDKVLLTYEGQDLATVEISSKWEPNKPLEAQQCYGTTSIEHPAVHMICTERGRYYMGAPSSQTCPVKCKAILACCWQEPAPQKVPCADSKPPSQLHHLTSPLSSAGGKVRGLALPKRVFPCASPAEVRATLPEGVDVLAFQCRNPIHKAHYELFTRALDAPNVGEGAVCLVHPTCGPTQVSLAPAAGPSLVDG